MNTFLPRWLFAGLALVSTLSAQTWIGSTSLNWEDAANWNPAVVPDGAGAAVTFTSAGLPTTTSNVIMSGNHTLAGIQFATGTPTVVLFVDNSGGPASLTLEASGLKNSSALQEWLWLSSPNFTGTSPIELTFRNQATVTGDIKLVGIGSDRLISFRDQSSAGSAKFAAYVVDFYDQATAGAAVFDQGMGQQITFHDNSTAGSAQLPGFYGSVTFADNSSAGNATVIRPSNYGGSSQVIFRDHAGAGHGAFLVNNLSFSGNSSAENAAINNAGVQYYSSHGAYATFMASLVFSDQATAGQAVIGNNSLGALVWTDDATADHATITSNGTATWSGRAAFADARLVAGSGSYYGYGGYNQPAPSIPTGGVYFKDQAQGGNGSIEIASAGTWLDFSGLSSGAGTTGRAALPAAPAGTSVVPDDRVGFALGSLTNTTAGGNIYLGGTVLALGSNNRDMTLSARITDVGGAYGSAAGETLAGGGLLKVGTGTLTLTNPNNNFSGGVDVFSGTLNLAGGVVSRTTLADTGRLTGTGAVHGVLANGASGTAAVVSPGNSAGTITVTGDYIQYAGGTLNMEIASATSRDQLIVNGRAFLDGRLNVSLIGGYVPVGNATLSLLSATEVHGQFATITRPAGLGAALTTAVVAAPSGISLQVTQLPFSGFASGTSPAAAALGSHIDATLATSTGEYRALLAGLNTLPTDSAIVTALEALAPDRYSVLAANSFLTSATQQMARDRHLAALRARTTRGFDVFFEAGQRRASFDATSDRPAARSSAGGGTAGGAWHNEGFALGATVTQEQGDIDLDAAGSKADLKGTVPAVFFQYTGNRWFANAAAAFSHDDYDLQRHIAYSGFDRTATAATAGTRNDVAANVGAVFRSAAWSFTPQAGVLASRWAVNRFTESGADGANLTVFDQSVRSVRTRVGFAAATSGGHFSPQLSLFWLHETGDDQALSAAFASASSSPYAAPGRPAEADVVQASLGFDYRLGKHAVFNASLAAAWGRSSAVTSDLSAGFRWEF